MTTYELIRKLVKLDPDGDMPVMISIRVSSEVVGAVKEPIYEAVAFPSEFSIDEGGVKDGLNILIIEGTDA